MKFINQLLLLVLPTLVLHQAIIPLNPPPVPVVPVAPCPHPPCRSSHRSLTLGFSNVTVAMSLNSGYLPSWIAWLDFNPIVFWEDVHQNFNGGVLKKNGYPQFYHPISIGIFPEIDHTRSPRRMYLEGQRNEPFGGMQPFFFKLYKIWCLMLTEVYAICKWYFIDVGPNNC
jgi:hypothetical protein